MNKVASLFRKDARVIYRDSYLRFVIVIPPVMSLLTRIVIESVPLANFALFVAPALVSLSGGLLGFVYGFGMIEEREQQTWQLLRVLPLSNVTLFVYLTGTATLFAFALSLVSAVAYHYPVANLAAFVIMVAVISLLAPTLMLILGILAKNKIEGVAVWKLTSAVFALPALVFFVPTAWQPLLYWCPTYWMYLGLLRAYCADVATLEAAMYWPQFPMWLVVTVPTIECLALIVLLSRIHRRQVQ